MAHRSYRTLLPILGVPESLLRRLDLGDRGLKRTTAKTGASAKPNAAATASRPLIRVMKSSDAGECPLLIPQSEKSF